MKICFFTESKCKGGVDTFLINLFNFWPDSQDDLTLICNCSHPGLVTISSKTRRPITIKKYACLFTTRLSQWLSSSKIGQSLPVRTLFALGHKFIQYPILLPWYLLKLSFVFYRSDYDRLMVVNGGYPASLLCRCAVIAWKISGKQPLAILNIHSSATNPPWYFRAPESLIDQAVICSSSSIVNVSQASLETLNNRKAFVGCKKLRFIHNGIEEPRPPHSATEEVGSLEETDDCYCLMLATYQRYKGHDYLLKAFKNVVKEFPNCHLQIYGFEKTHEKLRVAIMVNQLSLEKNVSLNDFIHETKLLIQNAEIVVVPSQAFESFGLTIIEAMALGTPVVATNVGGLPEVVADSNAGYICSKNDPNEFAIAMKRILGDQSLAAELGRNGRRFFKERFTAKRMANQYEKIIKQSIEVKL